MGISIEAKAHNNSSLNIYWRKKKLIYFVKFEIVLIRRET